MPQSRERKREYNRLRQRRLRGYKGGEGHAWASLSSPQRGGESERGVVPNVVPVDKRDVVPERRLRRELLGGTRRAQAWWWERIAQMPMGAVLCILSAGGLVVAVETGEVKGTLLPMIEPGYEQQPTYRLLQEVQARVTLLEANQTVHEATAHYGETPSWTLEAGGSE